jgi:predicted membrane-bound spermidine synthase
MTRRRSENPIDAPRASAFVTDKDGEAGDISVHRRRILRQAPGARACLIVCFGLFSIGAQTLLFREAMTAFEGHDIGVGCFFGAWFLWIAVGALIVCRFPDLVTRLTRITELLFMGYVPAFCLQYGLIVFFRDLAGIEPYAFLSLQHILGGCLLVTAPVSLLTGMLFPVLCRWVETEATLPVGRVYVLEAVGSLLGGLGVTVMYYYGAGTACIFLALAMLSFAVAAWSSWLPCSNKPSLLKRVLTLTGLLLCVAAWVLRADTSITRMVQTRKWQELLPTGTLQGAFLTPQAEYLCGTYQDQWIVMREGSACETLGDQTEAGRLAAMTLCQNVAAERILVFGDGLELCRSFLKSTHVSAVDWFHPDPHYIAAMTTQVPETLLPKDERLHCHSGDVRDWLSDHAETYDIVMLNLPETTNAVSMRFMTREFLAQVKQSLGYGGLVALGIPGGENVLGEELVYVGACTRETLATQFSQTLLVPGERSFFLCSNLPYLDDSPAVLQRRFQVLENAQAIYPPEALSTLYRPQKAKEVLQAYDQLDWAPAQLVNSYARPNHYLYQLLFVSKQSGLSLLGPAHTLMRSGPRLLLFPVILLMLVRIIYLAKTVSRRCQSVDSEPVPGRALDVTLLVGAAGAVGIGTVIILMYMFQMRYGSLYFYVGVISSLFMLGLSAGAFCLQRSLTRYKAQAPRTLAMLLMLVTLHGICLLGIGLSLGLHLSQWDFALFLLLGGLCCGGYVPLAARILNAASMDMDSTAGRLQAADHLGAALGGCLASLLLIPLFGAQWALYTLAIFILIHIVLLGTQYYQLAHPGPRIYAHPLFTPLGYVLFAVTLCGLAASYIVTQAELPSVSTENSLYVEAWMQRRRMTEKTVDQASAGEGLDYAEIHKGTQLKGYVFDSAAWSEPVYGYGGPMALVAFAEPNGLLIDFKVTHSQETPGYLQWLGEWMASLRGQGLFGAQTLDGVDGVSGATLSSQAILSLLANAGQHFAGAVLAQEAMPEPISPHWTKTLDWKLLSWASALILALAAIYHGRLWSRVLVLTYVTAISGFWLNRQYALDQVTRLLQGEGLLSVPLASLCLLLGVPLLVCLFGNIYCGYLCPFGALQELLGLIIPKRYKPTLALSALTQARFIKYGLLFVLVLGFFISRNTKVLGSDPLVSFFSLRFRSQDIVTSTGFVIALLVLVGGLFFTRLWCRYLCPTGAFLSLFNHLAGPKRLFPAKKLGRCEFGLSTHDQLDCIYCDRCRYQSPLIPARADTVTRSEPGLVSRLFLLALLCMAILICAPAWQPGSATGFAVAASDSDGPVGLQGKPRDVDVERIEEMIQQGRLSDQEALFYRRGPDDGNQP